MRLNFEVASPQGGEGQRQLSSEAPAVGPPAPEVASPQDVDPREPHDAPPVVDPSAPVVAPPLQPEEEHDEIHEED